MNPKQGLLLVVLFCIVNYGGYLALSQQPKETRSGTIIAKYTPESINVGKHHANVTVEKYFDIRSENGVESIHVTSNTFHSFDVGEKFTYDQNLFPAWFVVAIILAIVAFFVDAFLLLALVAGGAASLWDALGDY